MNGVLLFGWSTAVIYDILAHGGERHPDDRGSGQAISDQ